MFEAINNDWHVSKTDLRSFLSSFRINTNKAFLYNYIDTDENHIQRQILKVVKGRTLHYLWKSNRKTYKWLLNKNFICWWKSESAYHEIIL